VITRLFAMQLVVRPHVAVCHIQFAMQLVVRPHVAVCHIQFAMQLVVRPHVAVCHIQNCELQGISCYLFIEFILQIILCNMYAHTTYWMK
jgi:hypothetical protein